jgi:outer membrane beta-barrel protein
MSRTLIMDGCTMSKLRLLNGALALACLLSVPGSASALEQSQSEDPDLKGPHVLREKKVRLRYDQNVIRTGPGETFSIVATRGEGEEFLVIAKRDDWYNIRLSDTNTGWVHSSLCEEFDDMSDLEFRPNPRLFSRVGSFSLSVYAGGYAFDRKSNSAVLGGKLGYFLFEFLELEGGVSWTQVSRPAEIVESLFNLSLEEEEFDMLFYNMNVNLRVLPGRQMVPYATFGVGSSIMEGQSEPSINYGLGVQMFVSKRWAMRWEVRNYNFESGAVDARRENNNLEFSIGTSMLF